MQVIRDYVRSTIRDAATYSGLAFLIYALWPRGLWLAAACACVAVVMPPGKD